ncbi:uncharacterized protein At1g28695-like isoform X1 [Macadamia integrifolia]|uniref:uncharacterized protein At1g28695-like isoform X1 n=1 Tax=Macadamia integrifolia TaxID=60698 RepID=UPI001C4F4EEE|nr:uncharacterized protein At1g28695-like isoform X1 [Macadamia integrifolia]
MDYFSKGSMAHLAVISILFSGLLYLCIWSPPSFSKSLTNISIPKDELTIALDRASMGNKTVIIAIVNKAYIQRDNLEKTMFDLFLEGFWLGEDTRGLLDHLLVVAMDQVAYDRCKFLRFHCYRLVTEGVDFREEKIYMSKDFIMVMWKRTQFLGDVLKHGYNFIFTDTDVMWLRNPFLKLIKDEEAEDDLQISCDGFNGNSRSEANQINTGFYFIRSNNKTIALFEQWHAMRNDSPGLKEQDVLVNMMHRGVFRELGLRLRILETVYFSGFCQDSPDFNAVTTVHANCCRGLNAKMADLADVLRDWRKFKDSANHTSKWSEHNACIHSW